MLLQLSDDAVEHLIKIEKLAISKSKRLQTECEKFYFKFGSHASRGPFHFGGIYQWKSYSSDFTKPSVTDVEKLQREAIQFQVPVPANTTVSVDGYESELIQKYPTFGDNKKWRARSSSRPARLEKWTNW